jgi:membrane-bound ClpP family serine protease
MKNARIIIAIITNLLDEAIIVAIIIFGLPRLGVHIPLYGSILIGAAFLVYALAFYTIGSSILRKKPMLGFTSMVGTGGRVVSQLAPEGFVRIQGELWQAKTERGTIDAGADVIVKDQYGFKLVVRQK